MTLYQEIERDLLARGWSRSQGKGDHMKFTKPGVPTIITVSRSIGGRGCSLQNCLARIRKYEPDFWRDRTVVVPEEETIDYGAFPDIKPWMRPGETVRWTAAEGRDYSKLAEENSVMNARYVVAEIIPLGENEPGKARLTISPDGDDDQAFQVGPEDVDAWDTGVCSVCGKMLPVNRLCTVEGDADGKSLLCADCAAKMVAEKEPDEAPKAELQESAGEMLPDIPGVAELKELRDKYFGVPIRDLPDDAKAKIREIFADCPSKARKEFRKTFPDLYAILEPSAAAKKKVFPYDAWKMFAEEFVARKRPRNSERAQELMNKFLNSATYNTPRKVKGPDGTFLRYDIMVKDYDTLLDIWSISSILIREMFKAHEKDKVCFRLCCQKANVCQYLVPPVGEAGREEVQNLLASIPDKESEQLARAKLDTALPNWDAVLEKVNRCIGETVDGIDGVDVNKFAVVFRLALRDCDREDFESGLPYYEIDILYDDTVISDEVGNQVLSNVCGLNLGTPYAVSMGSFRSKDYGRHVECFGTFFDVVEKVEETIGAAPADRGSSRHETYGWKDGQTLFKVANEGGSLGFFLGDVNEKERPDDYAEYFERLCAMCYEFLTTDVQPDILRRALRHAVDSVRGDVEKMSKDNRAKLLAFWGGSIDFGKRAENNNIVMDKNYLDLTNPASENSAAGEITTRELLRELKARGVSFDGLQITIKSDINIDEI